MNKYISTLKLALISMLLLASCAPKAKQIDQVKTQPTDQNGVLTVSLVYPIASTEIEMGKSFKGIIKVLDEQGKIIKDAQVSVSVSDPSGKVMANIPATFGSGDVYRNESWIIPHKMQAGVWNMTVEAKTETKHGTASGDFRVNGSLSEILLGKYGFWINSPALRGIVPNLVKEQGNAENGMIIWGGQLPAQHVFPESWLEVQWRQGDFKL
ncbi:MAG TPA: hypothetical protein VK206_08105, partial [Anaerolineales bacterium]|nr:hypothetical protein [Anaerolineales bacterium]